MHMSQEQKIFCLVPVTAGINIISTLPLLLQWGRYCGRVGISGTEQVDPFKIRWNATPQKLTAVLKQVD